MTFGRLIEAARQHAASAVNAELALLFWRIGQRIHTEVYRPGSGPRTGEEIIHPWPSSLSATTGASFTDKNLRRMVQFTATYPEEPILVTLSRRLSWSHFVASAAAERSAPAGYYAQMASAARWSVRTLRERIDSMFVRAHGAVPKTRRNHRAGVGRPCAMPKLQ